MHPGMLVRPPQQRIIVNTFMLAALSGPGLCLPLQRRVGIARDPLPQIVDAMYRVVRYLLRQLDPGVPLLEVLYYVGKAVQLMEHRDHVAWTVVVAIYSNGIGLRKIVGPRFRCYDVSSTCCERCQRGYP